MKMPLSRNRVLLHLCFVMQALCIALQCIPAKGELSQGVISKIKDAAVQIQVVSEKQQFSGSGFFVSRELIATNAHVLGIEDPWKILGGEVTVVLQSGTEAERSIGAKIAGADVGQDIAFLRVPTQPGIEPLNLIDSAKVIETLPIYVVGFPLGNSLDLVGRNAAVSFGSGRVSSLRRNADGVLTSIQVDANLNPGNSGGPIVNQDGAVVAMSVATITGTNVGFSVPADQIKEDLGGRICDLALTTNDSQREGLVIEAKLRIIDPMRKVSQAAVYYWQSETDDPTAVPKDNLTRQNKTQEAIDHRQLNDARRGLQRLKELFPDHASDAGRLAQQDAVARAPANKEPERTTPADRDNVANDGTKVKNKKQHFRLTRHQDDDIWEGRVQLLATDDGLDLWVQPAIAIEKKPRLVDAINLSRNRREQSRTQPEEENEPKAETLADQIMARARGRLAPTPKIPSVQPTRFTQPRDRLSKESAEAAESLNSLSQVIQIASQGLRQLAIDPLGEWVYAIYENESSIRIYNTHDFSLEHTILVARFPDYVWCDDEVIVVACGESRVIQFIDRNGLHVRRALRVQEQTLTPIRIVGRAPDGSLATIWKLASEHHVILVDEELPELPIVIGETDWVAFNGNENSIWLQDRFEGRRGGTGTMRRLDEVKASLTPPSFTYRGQPLKFITGFGHASVSRDKSRFLLPLQAMSTPPKTESKTFCFETGSLDAEFKMPGYVVAEHPSERIFVSWAVPDRSRLSVYYLDRGTGAVTRTVSSQVNDLYPLTLADSPITPHVGYIPGRELFVIQLANGVHIVPCCPPLEKRESE